MEETASSVVDSETSDEPVIADETQGSGQLLNSESQSTVNSSPEKEISGSISDEASKPVANYVDEDAVNTIESSSEDNSPQKTIENESPAIEIEEDKSKEKNEIQVEDDTIPEENKSDPCDKDVTTEDVKEGSVIDPDHKNESDAKHDTSTGSENEGMNDKEATPDNHINLDNTVENENIAEVATNQEAVVSSVTGNESEEGVSVVTGSLVEDGCGLEDNEGGDVFVGVAPLEQQSVNRNERRVRFSEEVEIHKLRTSSAEESTSSEISPSTPTSPSRGGLPCLPQLTPQQLLNGVVYQAQYLGSTPVMFGVNQKTVRMQQAREAVRLLKESQGDTQPRIDIDLKINVKDIIIADRKTNVDLITHPLRTVSYVADIENSLVIMAHRNPPSSPGMPLKLNCHILETADPREVAMVIGQAFSTAYKEFLKSHGIKEESLEKFEYQHVLSSQTKSYLEINSLADESQTKEISFAKHKGEMLGLMVIDSGYGSAIPSCIIAHMNKGCAASKSSLLNVGDHILSINGTSLVGMPLKVATEQIKKCRYLTVVKMTTSACPPVTDVTIMRPDLKFQLGFAVKDGTVCSLWRGSIAERSGIRVGHRIIEINGTSAVGLTHEEIVHMLLTTVGDIHIRTMPMMLYQILTGKITPEYY